MSIANRFSLFELPPSLKSYNPTDTEERCTVLGIPFMQLKQIGCRKEFGIHSNTVNVRMMWSMYYPENLNKQQLSTESLKRD